MQLLIPNNNVQVREWMNNHIPLFDMDVITYPCQSSDGGLNHLSWEKSPPESDMVITTHRWWVLKPSLSTYQLKTLLIWQKYQVGFLKSHLQLTERQGLDNKEQWRT